MINRGDSTNVSRETTKTEKISQNLLAFIWLLWYNILCRNNSGQNTFTLSTSIGITRYEAKDVNELSDLIDIADANMYEQKRKKREGR